MFGWWFESWKLDWIWLSANNMFFFLSKDRKKTYSQKGPLFSYIYIYSFFLKPMWSLTAKNGFPPWMIHVVESTEIKGPSRDALCSHCSCIWGLEISTSVGIKRLDVVGESKDHPFLKGWNSKTWLNYDGKIWNLIFCWWCNQQRWCNQQKPFIANLAVSIKTKNHMEKLAPLLSVCWFPHQKLAMMVRLCPICWVSTLLPGSVCQVVSLRAQKLIETGKLHFFYFFLKWSPNIS